MNLVGFKYTIQIRKEKVLIYSHLKDIDVHVFFFSFLLFMLRVQFSNNWNILAHYISSREVAPDNGYLS